MAGGMWFVTGIPGDSAKSLVWTTGTSCHQPTNIVRMWVEYVGEEEWEFR